MPRTRRVKVYRSQKQRRGALATLRQITLSTGRLATSVTYQRLSVNAERHACTHLTVLVVSEQYRPGLLEARVVGRQVRRMPAGLGGEAHMKIGQGTDIGVVDVVEQREDGRLENGQLQRLLRLVDVSPVS